MSMASALAPATFSLACPAARRAAVALEAAAAALRRAGLAAACPPARSLGADPRLAIRVALRCRSASAAGRGARAAATMAKKSVGDLAAVDLEGKRVLVRADLNVPLDDSKNITDDTRVRAAIPAIRHLVDKGARVILCSDLGRPKGVTPKFSLAPLVPRLSELLGMQVQKANDFIGPEVEKLVSALPNGSVLLLENVRFCMGKLRELDHVCRVNRTTEDSVKRGDLLKGSYSCHSTHLARCFLQPPLKKASVNKDIQQVNQMRINI